jgi:hypothetical protein
MALPELPLSMATLQARACSLPFRILSPVKTHLVQMSNLDFCL